MKSLKSKTKRMLALFMVLCTILSFGGVQASTQNEDDTTGGSPEQMYSKSLDTLLSLGLSMDTIKDIPQDELLTFANTTAISSSQKYYRIMSKKQTVNKSNTNTKNGKVEEKIIEGTKKVVELTKDECMGEIKKYSTDESSKYNNDPKNSNTTDLTPTASYDNDYDIRTDTDGWIRMELWVTHVSGTKYKLSSRWEWLTTPQYRLEDVFGIGFGEGFTWTNDPVNSVYKYERVQNNNSESFTTWQTNTPVQLKKDSGGVAVTYGLEQNNYYFSPILGDLGYKCINHRGYLSYYVNVNSTAIRYIGVYSHYAHQQTSTECSPGISYPWGGSLSITQATKFDFLSPNPACSIHVNY